MVSFLAVVTEVLMKVVVTLVMAVTVRFTVARILLLQPGRREGFPGEQNSVPISAASDGNPVRIGFS